MAGWLGKLTGLFKKEAQTEQETSAPETGSPVLDRLHQLEVMDQEIADLRAETDGIEAGASVWEAPPGPAEEAALSPAAAEEPAPETAETQPEETQPEETLVGGGETAGLEPELEAEAPAPAAGMSADEAEEEQAPPAGEPALEEAIPEEEPPEEPVDEEEAAEAALPEGGAAVEEGAAAAEPPVEEWAEEAPACEEVVDAEQPRAELPGEEPPREEMMGEGPPEQEAPEGTGVELSWDEVPAETVPPAPEPEGEGKVFEDDRSPVKVRLLPDPDGYTSLLVTDGLNGFDKAELVWAGVPSSFQEPAAAILLALGSYMAEGAQLGAGEALTLREDPPVSISLHELQEKVRAMLTGPAVQVGIVDAADGSHTLEFNDAWLSNALLSQGMDDLQDGKYEEAERDFTGLLAYSAQEAAHWLMRARARYYLERYEDALADCQQAAQHDQESAEVFALGGACLVRLGMADDARQLFEQALALEPGNELAREELKELDQA